MIQTEIVDALMSLVPDTPWAVEGDDYSTIVWLNEDAEKPIEQAIELEIARQKEELELARIAKEEAEMAKQAAKASALAKLSALGLTPEEVEAIIGV